MSLLLKSELRLRIGARHCLAEVWRAGLPARCMARVATGDEPQNLLESALNALAAQGVSLPKRAVVLIEDELLYLATLPANGGLKTGLAAAQEHFGTALPDQEMAVDVSLMDSGQHWLAVALPADLLETWRLALSAHDLELASAQPAVLQDLAALGSARKLDLGLVVMLGAEGLNAVTVRERVVSGLHWERRDMADLPGLGARLQALLEEVATANDTSQSGKPDVLVVPQTRAQAAALRPLVESQGWHLSFPSLSAFE